MKPMAAAGNKLKERFRVYRERSRTCRRGSRNVPLGGIETDRNTFVASTKMKIEIARCGGAFSIPRCTRYAASESKSISRRAIWRVNATTSDAINIATSLRGEH